MLTRIEINGFKTFSHFGIDINPFLVILGANASGKSNLFDAIRLLKRLAETDLSTAIQDLRGVGYELFRQPDQGEPVQSFSFAVEVLLEPEVFDPWGTQVKINHSRIRYEVEIERRIDKRGIERLVIASETAKPILASHEHWLPYHQKPAKAFQKHFLKYARETDWLSTEKTQTGQSQFHLHDDMLKGRTRSATAAEATILSSITNADYPHLYALREELRSWQFLQLAPHSLRRPSAMDAPRKLLPDGANLPTVLAHIQAETKSDDFPLGALVDIRADLVHLIPGIVDIRIEKDSPRREYRIEIVMHEGTAYSSNVVSDGTLRILALLTQFNDPQHQGLVCFEEPENGIHPQRLKSMIQRLRELVTQPQEDAFWDEPLSQILMNSHSPVVLSGLEVEKGEVMFADRVSQIDLNQTRIRKTRFREVSKSDEIVADQNQVWPSEVERYLATVDKTV
ncbi:MAG TPA: hypothetical protein DCM38_08200 [Gammaproteobacteria bacterium]|nr:AAA family ATPase [Candidatus Parabeggiatoa sp.]HAI69402.1 hypothetical protein [Gammaproteobacteria bacterium]